MLQWDFILDVGQIGCALLLASFLRSRVGILQRFCVPNNIVAGFILLLLSDNFLGVLKISSDRYGLYVYHLLAITFIAMALRKTESKGDKGMATATGLLLTLGYTIQTLIGMVVTIITILFFKPDLFPTFGYFLVLGFGQGPGQAFALGKSWESLGFADAGNLGLTFAAFGYFWACIVGVLIVYLGQRKAQKNGQGAMISLPEEERTGFIRDVNRQPEAGRLNTSSAAIDGLSFQLAMVGFVYISTYLVLILLEKMLEATLHGDVLQQLTCTMWGLHFIFATVTAIFFRNIVQRLNWVHLLDDGLLTRISGTSLDFMVTAAISAISVGIFMDYFVLVLILTTLGGGATLLLVKGLTRKLDISHKDNRIASIFGTLTGTLSTGLTLSRIMDPEFKTTIPQDLIFGCGLAFPLTIPIILSVMVPLNGMNEPNPMLYYLGVTLFLIVYGCAVFGAWYWISKKITPNTRINK